MKKQERVRDIMETLENLYPETPVPLHSKNPFTFLIAVLLSAQCTDERVNKTTPTLFSRADNPEAMSQLEVAEIEDIIRPCGLAPRKASSISQLSQIVLDKFDGNIPKSMNDLESLPGVGHKTASVVMAQIFDEPAFPVDTHIHRLAYRWKLSTGKNVTQTEKDLKRLFPKSSWNKLHLQIIFFGREYCPARGHNPYDCPICKKHGRMTMFHEFDKKNK